MSFEPNVNEPEKQSAEADLAKQFSEIYLKKQENISTLLELLEVTRPFKHLVQTSSSRLICVTIFHYFILHNFFILSFYKNLSVYNIKAF